MKRKTKIERICLGAVLIYIFVIFAIGVIIMGVGVANLVNTAGEKEKYGGTFEEVLEECNKLHPKLHQEMLDNIVKKS